MEHLLGKLTAGSTDLSAVLGGSDGTTKGLDKILAISGLNQQQINVLYGCYLDQRLPLIKLKGHLLLEFKDRLDNHYKHSLRLVNGAVNALKDDCYKMIDCYKCGGNGLVKELTCARCGGIGKASQKPKEYQLCGISRSLWYKKESKQLRELFADLVTYMLQLDTTLKQTVKSFELDS